MKSATYFGLALALIVSGCQPANPSVGEPTAVPNGGLTPEPMAVPADFQAGQALYEQYCQSCHGVDARGSDKGPPFIDPIYRPGHHADGSFVMAATSGVRAHHWRFGDMPPVQGVQPAEVEKIVAYVRYLQRQAGIE